MPKSINALIESYIETCHKIDDVKMLSSLQEIVLYRMGGESTKNPLSRDNRFIELKNLCGSDRGTQQPVDEILIEECMKLGRLHTLNDSIAYGGQGGQ